MNDRCLITFVTVSLMRVVGCLDDGCEGRAVGKGAEELGLFEVVFL